MTNIGESDRSYYGVKPYHVSRSVDRGYVRKGLSSTTIGQKSLGVMRARWKCSQPKKRVLLLNLWVNLDAVAGRKLGMVPGRSAGHGNANRRIVRIASPWLAATVSVPGLVSPGCPENGQWS